MTKQVLGRDEVLRLLREHMPALRERFGVTSLALFGSTARDEATAGSDVDVLVEFDREPEAAWGSYEARTYLSEVLGRRVDMVERHRMRKEYLPWVTADEVDPMNPREPMPGAARLKRPVRRHMSKPSSRIVRTVVREALVGVLGVAIGYCLLLGFNTLVMGRDVPDAAWSGLQTVGILIAVLVPLGALRAWRRHSPVTLKQSTYFPALVRDRPQKLGKHTDVRDAR